MTATASDETKDQRFKDALRQSRRRSKYTLYALVGVAVYLVISWFALDVGGVLERAKPDNMAKLTRDSVGYETYAVRDLRFGEWETTVEQVVELDEDPNWMTRGPDGQTASFDLGDGVLVEVSDTQVAFTAPDYGDFVITIDGRDLTAEMPPRVYEEETAHEPLMIANAVRQEQNRLARIAANRERRAFESALEEADTDIERVVMRAERFIEGVFSTPPQPQIEPSARERIERIYDEAVYTPWLIATDGRFDARIGDDKRIVITAGSRIEIRKYTLGWEFFFFEAEHKELNSMNFIEIVSALFDSEPINPEAQRVEVDPNSSSAAEAGAFESNVSYVWHSFLGNQYWQHEKIFRNLFETFLMAFVGTFLAAFFGLPLAFFGAKNFSPLTFRITGPVTLLFAPFRFASRRLFDFLRGVDMVIWSLIFIRAFGLGPLGGVFAIAFTDTGTLGKLFSEALENTDKKQIEGVSATGANQLQRYRFGVIPQIMPVFISQSLYYFESNIRSATVIGALTGVGIGDALVQGIQTHSRWEYVLYLIIVTIVLVVCVDLISGGVRRRLIEGGDRRGSIFGVLFAGAAGALVAYLFGANYFDSEGDLGSEAAEAMSSDGLLFAGVGALIFVGLTIAALLSLLAARRARRKAAAEGGEHALDVARA